MIDKKEILEIEIMADSISFDQVNYSAKWIIRPQYRQSEFETYSAKWIIRPQYRPSELFGEVNYSATNSSLPATYQLRNAK